MSTRSNSPQQIPEDIPDLVDVEELVKAGKPVPRARRYRIRIDKERYETTEPVLTGRQILALAGKTPEQYFLHQRVRGGHTTTIEANEKVNIAEPGVERFMTMKRETQDGLRESRRMFALSAGDQECLVARGEWETVVDGNAQWVIVHNLTLPPGYSPARVSMAVLMAPGYPEAPLDMAYFSPAIARADGKPIPALSQHSICSVSWQRWSRHRTAVNPWVPGEDSLTTHLAFIDFWLRDEFRSRP